MRQGAHVSRIAAIAWLAALSFPAAAGAATITVEPSAGQNVFAPKRAVEPLSEATFTWIWGTDGAGTSDFHDVVADGALFDSGEAVKEGSFEVSAAAGSFEYFCSIHFGMKARIAVRPLAEAGAPEPFRVRWATRESETGKRYDVRFKLENGPWRTWLENVRRRSAFFNAGARSRSTAAPRAYVFQARSENTELKASGWSPSLRVGQS